MSRSQATPPFILRAPILSNGISRQPVAARLPNQVEDATNVVFSVVDGASRRPGTRVEAVVPTGLLPAGNNQMQAILRDDQEQYLIVHNRTGASARLAIWDIINQEWVAEPMISVTAQEYLNAGSPDAFKFRTIADTTLVINTDRAVAALSNRPDPATMPMLLKRLPTDPVTFEMDVAPWKVRASGDAVTNPMPTFASEGRKISDIASFQGRLVVSSGESLWSTQAGDLFNFFIEDVLNVKESDPVKYSIGQDQISIITHLIPVGRTLLVMTAANGQFEFGDGEALKPSDIPFKTTTRHRTLPTRPCTMGPSVFFVANRSGSMQMLRYDYDEIAKPSSALDVTAHIEKLVPLRSTDTDIEPLTIRTIDASEELGMVFALPRIKLVEGPTITRQIFVYREYYDQAGRPAQQAWTRLEFGGISGIHDFAVVGSSLFLLVWSGSGVNLDHAIHRVDLGETFEDVPAIADDGARGDVWAVT